MVSIDMEMEMDLGIGTSSSSSSSSSSRSTSPGSVQRQAVARKARTRTRTPAMARSSGGSRSRSAGRLSRCCSEVSVCEDPQTVCCDAVECSPPEAELELHGLGKEQQAGDGADCPECCQSSETLITPECTEECFKEPARSRRTLDGKVAAVPAVPAAAAAACVECEGHPESIIACEDPGCDLDAASVLSALEGGSSSGRDGSTLLEWDEQAVDELLKCCCSDSGHHHTTFATPYTHASGAAHSHSHGLLARDGSAQGRTTESTAYAEPSSTFNFQLPIHTHHTRAHRQPHLRGATPSHSHVQGHHHASCPPLSNSGTTASSARSEISTSSGTFFTTPSLESISNPSPAISHASIASTQPAHGTASGGNAHWPLEGHLQGFQDATSKTGETGSERLDAVSPSRPGVTPTKPLPFGCEWSSCSERFATREELIGHVNVSHLLHVMASELVKEQPPASILATPQPLGSSAHIGDPVAGPGAQDQQTMAGDLASLFTAANTGGPMLEGSFEHTMRCLWDSCDASLPLVHTLSGQGHAQADGEPRAAMLPSVSQQNAPEVQPGGVVNYNMPHSQEGTDQQAATASLVKHLLQDHLHIPSQLLMQLSPAVSGAPANQTAGSGNSVAISHEHQGSRQSSSHAQPHYRQSHSAHNSISELPSPASFATYTPPPQIQPPSNGSPFGRQQTGQQIPQVAHDTGVGTGAAALFDAAACMLDPQATPQGQAPFPDVSTWTASSSRPGSSAALSALPAHFLPFGSESAGYSAGSGSHQSSAGLSSQTGSPDSPREAHACQWAGCTDSFGSTAALMDHISSAHIGSGKSMYHCHWQGCERAEEGRGFTQRQKVVRHVRTHVGDKPFVCSECGRGFSESTTLAQHIRTHTNEKPFACAHPGCGKSFAIQSALTIHMRTHSGEKPFKCPVEGCGMSFAESSNLSKHVKTHQNGGGVRESPEVGADSRKRRRKAESMDGWADSDDHRIGLYGV